jgi:hypothetical protein
VWQPAEPSRVETVTLAGPALPPLRVTLIAIEPPPSPALYVALESSSVPARSSSTIVTVSGGANGFAAEVMLTLKVSVPSGMPSFTKGMATILSAASPSANCTVVDVATKSWPAVALPASVATATETAPVLPPVRVTAMLTVPAPSETEGAMALSWTVPSAPAGAGLGVSAISAPPPPPHPASSRTSVAAINLASIVMSVCSCTRRPHCSAEAGPA